MGKTQLTIIHLTTSFPGHKDDTAGSFVSNLVRAIEKQGILNYVLTPAGPIVKKSNTIFRFKYAPRNLQKIASLPGGIPAALKKNPTLILLVPGFLGSMAFHLIAFAKRVDIIHAHWSICGFIASLTKPIHKKPVLTTLRGSDIKWSKAFLPYKLINEISLKGSSFTTGVSQKIVDDLKVNYPAMAHRFVFIPNGVSEAFMKVKRSSRPRTSTFRLLFIGSLIKRKGVDILLQALSLVNVRDNWRLTITGAGPEMAALKRLCRNLCLNQNVTFTGMVPPAEIPSLMANHHVLVLPSYSEGRPNVVIEAMASAMPVIGSDIDGTRELIQDGQTGCLVPPGNPKALAQALKHFMDHCENCFEMGNKAREWIKKEKLTWGETATRYLHLYRKINNFQGRQN